MSFKNSMNIDSIIVSDFLDDPDAVRSWVIGNCEKGFLNFNLNGNYPGKRTYQLANIDYRSMVESKLKQILPFKFKMDMEKSTSYAYQLCLEGTYSSVHVDPTKWGGVLYLTPNPPLDSGTFLYKDSIADELKELNSKMYNPNYTNEEKNRFMSEAKDSINESTEVTTIVKNVYNRMIIFRGGEVPHCKSHGFGDCLENGRLTQVFFIDEVM